MKKDVMPLGLFLFIVVIGAEIAAFCLTAGVAYTMEVFGLVTQFDGGRFILPLFLIVFGTAWGMLVLWAYLLYRGEGKK